MTNNAVRKKPIIVLFSLVSLFFAAWGLTALAARHPGAVEKLYSQGIYRWLAAPIAAFFALFPFSAAQILIPAAAISLCALFAIETVRAVLYRQPLRFLRAIAAIMAAVSVTYFMFVSLWALNYNRLPLSKTLGYPDDPPAAGDITSLFSELTEKINSLAAQIDFDSKGSSCYGKGKKALLQAVWDGYENLSAVNPALCRVRGRVKQVLGSRYMGYTGISGIYICFTGEPNVNGTLPHFSLAFTAAHEAAHLQGFAREDEANFIAYLSLRENPDPYLQYCGAAFMYTYLAGDAAAADPGSYNQISAALDPRVSGEFAAYSAFLDQYKSPVAEVAAKVNNTYLESQGQQGGTLTYCYVTRLLAADYLQRQKSPVTPDENTA